MLFRKARIARRFPGTDNLREWFRSFSYCKRARFSDIISIRNKNRKESVYVNAAF